MVVVLSEDASVPFPIARNKQQACDTIICVRSTAIQSALNVSAKEALKEPRCGSAGDAV